MGDYGIRGQINWLIHFLENKKIKEVVAGKQSEELTVDTGVLQGIILVPLLFLCRINDFPDAVKYLAGLLADDNKTRKDYNSPRTSQQHRRMNKQPGNAFQCHKMLHLEHQKQKSEILV